MIGLGLLTQGMNMNIQNVSYRRLYNGLYVRGSCIVYTNIQPVVQLVVESKQNCIVYILVQPVVQPVAAVSLTTAFTRN